MATPNLNNQPFDAVFTLIESDVDDETAQPTMKFSWEEGNVGAYVVTESGGVKTKTPVTELLIKGSAQFEHTGGAENFHLAVTEIDDAARTMTCTTTLRGIPNGEQALPPVQTHDSLYRSHKTGRVWLCSEVLLYKDMNNTFQAVSISETVTAGQALDSTSGALGVSIHDSKYYKYSVIDKDITAVADNGSGKARFTSVGHGLADGTYIRLNGFSEPTYNAIAVVAAATTDTFDVVAIDFTSTDTGNAAGFSNYQGVIEEGNTVAADATFTLQKTNGQSDNHTGLTAGSAYFIQDGGAVSTSNSTNSIFAGWARNTSTLIHSPRLNISQVPQSEVDAGAGTTPGTVTVDQITSLGGGGGPLLKSLQDLSEEDFLSIMSRADQADAQHNSYGHIGYSTGYNEKLAIVGFGSGVSGNTYKANIKKNGSPTDNIVLRIETDSGGFPSGTLVDANATASIAGASISSSYTEETFTFAGSFTIPAGTKVHAVFERSGALSTSNYFRLGLSNSKNTGIMSGYVSSSWGYSSGASSHTFQPYFDSTLIEHSGAFQTGRLADDFVGYAAGDISTGDNVEIKSTGIMTRFSGLDVGQSYEPDGQSLAPTAGVGKGWAAAADKYYFDKTLA